MNKIKFFGYSLIFCFYFLEGYAQYDSEPSLHVQKASSPITLDGVMNEPAWIEAEVANDFWQNFPMDTSKAIAKTEIRMTYDDDFIYIAAKCYSTADEEYYVTPSLRRDFKGSGIDVVTFIFDPFQDKTNAFFFGVNPYNVQREGLISNGGVVLEDFNLSWDNKWYSQTKIHDTYWLVEAAIPFKTIRFKEGVTHWNANFFRLDSKVNEKSAWSRIPRNFELYSLAYAGELLWDQPLKNPGANISLIPYVAGGSSKDYLAGDNANTTLSMGGDAKVAVTPALNLDLTVNPDFSQVEVDQQVTNLDRFEIFFPERRQFFLENADLFANFGMENTRPFFSRRIGVAIDTATGQNVQNPILFGARLSGRINNNWRVGLMNMQAGSNDAIDLPGFNYSVGAVQRRVFKRSNIAAIYINKQSFADSLTNEFTLGSGNYNRLIGLDYNLASADNKWNGKAYYHRSLDPGADAESYSHGATLLYSTLKWEISWVHQVVGKNYNAEVGFVPRSNFRRIIPSAVYYFYPKSKVINRHGPGIEQQLWWNEDMGMTDRNFRLFYQFDFLNTSQLSLSLLNDYIYLFAPFTPSGKGISFLSGDEFSQTRFSAEYRSDTRRHFYYQITTINGQYYNGFLNSFAGTLNYRYQPYGLFSLAFNYSNINLEEPYTSNDLFLIGPRLDLTLTRSVFFTTFIQYNSQFENININSRFQWRFQPVSDLFVVYTDNYFPGTFRAKNRALVLKLTYWMNL